TDPVRMPRAFTPERAEVTEEASFDPVEEAPLVSPSMPRMGWLGRIAWATGGALVAAGIGLAADRLIRDLFATQPWLGYVGLGLLGAFVVAVLALVLREMLALRRLRVLDALRADAEKAIAGNDRKGAGAVADTLL